MKIAGDQSWVCVGPDGKPVKQKSHKTTVRHKVRGCATSDLIRGAPPPKRDFFLSRVHKSSDDSQLENYISSKGITHMT